VTGAARPASTDGSLLEQTQGDAGNFAGFDRATADIKFISIVGGVSGFTVDDLS
jgi:hypothetical protein